MFSQTCFWTVFTLSRKSFQFAWRSLHDLLWTQSFVVQIARAILTTTSIQTHVRCAHLCLDRVSFPPRWVATLQLPAEMLGSRTYLSINRTISPFDGSHPTPTWRGGIPTRYAVSRWRSDLPKAELVFSL